MAEPTKFSGGPAGSTDPMFQEPSPGRSFPTAAVAIAVVVVVIAVIALFVLGRHGTNSAESAAYASSLELTNLQMSQSESLSGGKSTYIDGRIVNHGARTVTGATVQAEFGTDGGQPQTLTTPVAIIRTRTPYVDTEPLSAAPLAPGAQADFRLIFEGVSDAWNQQTPALKVTQVGTK